MLGVGGVEDDGALLADELGSPVVDVGGGVEPDAGVAVLVVVPAEEAAAEGAGVVRSSRTGRGTSGRYLRVRNWLSLNGLSLLTCGRLWLLVTPRSASRNATGLAVIGEPRSAWMVSWSRPMFCLATVSASSASARLAFSAWASIQPGT